MEKEGNRLTSPEKEPSSPNNDEFELTAEMMVNDFDDERTLDEEEALAEADVDQDNELSNLEKEKDIPISTLLEMYGYGENNQNDSSSSSEGSSNNDMPGKDQEVDNEGMEVEAGLYKEDIEPPLASLRQVSVEDEVSRDKRSGSMLQELYKEEGNSSCASRHLRSGSGQQSEEDEEEEDGDYSPDEEDWKKTIMVGSDFQAVTPEGLLKYDDAMPYENEDKLLWDPIDLPEKEVKDYLVSVQDIQTASASGIDSIPKGSHVADDEQALFLLHQCGNNNEEALRRIKLNSIATSDRMSLWSEEECRNFENGIRQYGKDFHCIQQNKVRTRSVNELVHFYYLWKKTERHDIFANRARLEKKKYTLHPGTTDYMERFLDEQDSPVPSPNIHSLLSGDPKRQSRNPSPGYSDAGEQITREEVQIINSHFEDIARHLDRESLESLVRLATNSTSPNPKANSASPNGISTTQQIDSLSVSPSRGQSFQSSNVHFYNHSSHFSQ